MRIIGLNGSPNSNGNTSVLINNILDCCKELGAQTTMVNVGEIMQQQKSGYCTVCTNPCKGVCYKGTELEKVYELLRDSDGVIIGSPVYFGSVSAQLKAFFDKTRKVRADKWLYNKVGICATVGASKFGGQETTIKAMHDMMLVDGMIIIGDGYIDDDCGHQGVAAVRPAQEDENAKKRARIAAKRLVEVCAATESIRTNK